MFTTGKTVGMAEGIINDPCLAVYIFAIVSKANLIFLNFNLSDT